MDTTKDQPLSNRATVLLLVLCAVMFAVGLLIATGALAIYNGTMNGGIVLGTDTWDVGFEWRGNVGFFHESGGDQPPPVPPVESPGVQL